MTHPPHQHHFHCVPYVQCIFSSTKRKTLIGLIATSRTIVLRLTIYIENKTWGNGTFQCVTAEFYKQLSPLKAGACTWPTAFWCNSVCSNPGVFFVRGKDGKHKILTSLLLLKPTVWKGENPNLLLPCGSPRSIIVITLSLPLLLSSSHQKVLFNYSINILCFYLSHHYILPPMLTCNGMSL